MALVIALVIFWLLGVLYKTEDKSSDQLLGPKNIQFFTPKSGSRIFVQAKPFCQQLCEINATCDSWHPYRKIMSSHLSVITSRLLQMCHCTAYEYGVECILNASVDRSTQGFPTIEVCPWKNFWFVLWKISCVQKSVQEEFVLCWWNPFSRFVDMKSKGTEKLGMVMTQLFQNDKILRWGLFKQCMLRSGYI